MSDFPQVFTFYSYKGGVGRSMAVLNVAYALVAKGRNVLVLDMDLEAPGLSGFLRRHREIGEFARQDMVDLVRWAADFSIASQQSTEPLDAASFPPLTDFIVSVPREKLEPLPHPYAELGRLDIVPVDEERDYYGRLTALAMGNFERDALVRVSSILHAWLKSRRFAVDVPDYYGPNADRTAAYDYVLVDSRTGVTETGGLCIGPLSDQLVVLTALNDQNVEGTRRFLEEVGILAKRPSTPTEHSAGDDAAPRLDPKPTLIVASPVPAGETKTKRDRLQQLEAAVGKAAVKLSYHPQLALLESIFTRDYRDEYLADEYEALAAHVLRMANDSTDVALTLMGEAFGCDSPADLREVARRIPGCASDPDIFPILHWVFSTVNVKQLADDIDFILWDRACRVASSGDHPTRFDVATIWADILTQWSTRSTQPELSKLRREAGMRRYDQVVQGEGASSRQKAKALVNRGVSYGQTADSEKAIADYTAVLQIPDALAGQKAQALVNRGLMYRQAGDLAKAIADCTAALQMPGAPTEPKAKALYNRALTYGETGDWEKRVADYTTLLQMPNAPTEPRAKALAMRGWDHIFAGRNLEAIEDAQNAVSLDPQNWEARLVLAIALQLNGQPDATLAALDATPVEHLSEIATVLERAIQTRGPLAGTDEVLARIEARRKALKH